ncbi:MAG: glycosyltransferase family 2 protein [Verrucomicrobia bacterium]|nr:glycosyltransferase family 2 protein [Verrucomicrobiota bacterium]
MVDRLKLRFSLLIPAHNEEEVLDALFRQVSNHLDRWVGGAWEVVLVDDGSTDRTNELAQRQCLQDPRFKAVVLSRNFGHQAAIATGLSYTGGEYVGVIDADLQDPLDVLANLFEQCACGGANVAFGVRQKRDAPGALKVCYRLFYRFMARFSDHPWPVDAGDFCVMDRQALRILLSMPESNRVLRGLRSWIGLKQIAVPYERPRRHAGRSKYNLVRLTELALDSVVNFSAAPLRLAGWCGLAMSLVCFALMLLFLLNRVFPGFSPFGYSVRANPGTATIVILITSMSAINFLCLGIIGQYLAILLKEVKQRPQAVVQALVGDLAGQPVAYRLSPPSRPVAPVVRSNTCSPADEVPGHEPS